MNEIALHALVQLILTRVKNSLLAISKMGIDEFVNREIMSLRKEALIKGQEVNENNVQLIEYIYIECINSVGLLN